MVHMVNIAKENRQDGSFRMVSHLFILFTYAFFWEDHQREKLQRKLQWKDTFHPPYSFILGHREKRCDLDLLPLCRHYVSSYFNSISNKLRYGLNFP